MDKTAIIEKVRFLLNLASVESTPLNEAEAAKNAANKLIEKFQLSEEEYQVVEVKPIYTDDELLFETKDFQEHLSQLALACSEKFDCLVIQERNVANHNNDTSYRYFVYGHPTDIIRTKALFSFVKKAVDSAISMYTRGRNKLYIDSFAEGVVNGVKINIEHEDFHIEGLVIQSEEQVPDGAIVPIESSKKDPPAIEEKTTVGLGKDEKPLDPLAFFYGEEKGRAIHIGKVMDDLLLEEEESPFLIQLFDKVKGILKDHE